MYALFDHTPPEAESETHCYPTIFCIPKLTTKCVNCHKFLTIPWWLLYLINMLYLLYRNADKSRTVATVTTTDFSKAFDRINHTLVLNKLIHLEVRPSIIPWIADFLTSREQCVRYNSICSTWLTLNAGVPQGTKLGPILFLVMINDVRPTGDNLAAFKYVDDLSIAEWRPSSQKSCLQDAIDGLTNWLMQNNMKLNPSKCFQMNIGLL